MGVQEKFEGTWLGRVWRAFTEGGLEEGSNKVDFGIAFTTLWAEIKTGLVNLVGRMGRWLSDRVWARLSGTQGGASLWSRLGKSFIEGLRIGMAEKLSRITWSDIGAAIRRKIGDGLRGSMEGFLKGMLNSIIQSFENTLNLLIWAANNVISAIRVLPGAPSIGLISPVQIPRLKQGGLVRAAEQLALLHGPELILPLNDPHTQMMLEMAIQEAMGGQAQQAVTIVNHFGADSVRSNADIRAISNAIQRDLELRGVRGRIG